MKITYELYESAIVDSLSKFTLKVWDQVPFGHLVIDDFLPLDLFELLL